MKSFLVRGIEEELLEEIKRRAKSESVSMNQFILSVIRAGTGFGRTPRRKKRFNDLDLLAGRWDEEEYRLINREVMEQRKIDKELWS